MLYLLRFRHFPVGHKGYSICQGKGVLSHMFWLISIAFLHFAIRDSIPISEGCSNGDESVSFTLSIIWIARLFNESFWAAAKATKSKAIEVVTASIFLIGNTWLSQNKKPGAFCSATRLTCKN